MNINYVALTMKLNLKFDVNLKFREAKIPNMWLV